MERLFALLLAGIVMYFMSLILLNDRKKVKKGTIGSLIDDDTFRDSVRKETNTLFEKRLEPMMQENRGILATLFKICMIDLEKIETLLIRAGETKKSKEEVAVFQLAYLICGVVGFIVFKFLNADAIICIAPLAVGLLLYMQVIVNLKNKHKALQKTFKKDFPNFLEAYRIPIENGMQADVAFRRVTEDWEGVVGEEFKKAVIESRNHQEQLFIPLQKLAYKLNYPSFYNFVSTFSTTLRSGSDMAPFIGSICNDIRITTHNEVMEQNRQKEGPILILIVFFIFLPAVFMMAGPMFIKAFTM